MHILEPKSHPFSGHRDAGLRSSTYCLWASHSLSELIRDDSTIGRIVENQHLLIAYCVGNTQIHARTVIIYTATIIVGASLSSLSAQVKKESGEAGWERTAQPLVPSPLHLCLSVPHLPLHPCVSGSLVSRDSEQASWSMYFFPGLSQQHTQSGVPLCDLARGAVRVLP